MLLHIIGVILESAKQKVIESGDITKLRIIGNFVVNKELEVLFSDLGFRKVTMDDIAGWAIGLTESQRADYQAKLSELSQDTFSWVLELDVQ